MHLTNFHAFLASHKLRQTTNATLNLNDLNLNSDDPITLKLRRAYNELWKYLSNPFPLTREKYSFVHWLASDEIQAINDIAFWQMVLYKFLLNLGIELRGSDREKILVNAKNLELIKNVIRSFESNEPGYIIPNIFLPNAQRMPRPR